MLAQQEAPTKPLSWKADKFKTIYIRYEGRRFQCAIEAEFYHDLYSEGLGYVNLCCPLCQKGEDDIEVQTQGDPLARTLTIRRESKHFEVSSDLKLTVDEPITCTYCGLWSVRITDGIAVDSF